jgi:hypothetical protein
MNYFAILKYAHCIVSIMEQKQVRRPHFFAVVETGSIPPLSHFALRQPTGFLPLPSSYSFFLLSV